MVYDMIYLLTAIG